MTRGGWQRVIVWGWMGLGTLRALSHGQAPPRITFTHYTTLDGLAHNSGNCFAQDEPGFLWIGSNGGLERFDGYRFKIYKPERNNPSGLSGIIVWSLYVDKNNTLWVGTIGGGLNRYVREKDAFVSYRHDSSDPRSLSSDNVSRIFQDRAGRLWITTKGGGINRFEPETGEFERFGMDSTGGFLKDAVIHDFCITAEDEIWLGTEQGISVFNPVTGRTRPYHRIPGDLSTFDGMPIVSLLASRTGRIWIGTWRRGLYQYDPETGIFLRFVRNPKDPFAIQGDDNYQIFEDSQGSIWIATENGVHRYVPERKGFYRYATDPFDPKSLSDNFVRSIFEDKTGVLWFGTNNGGLNKCDLHRKRFLHYAHRPMEPHSLSNNHVNTIHEDPAGRIWIGTRDGLNRFDRASGRFVCYRNDPSDPTSLGHNSVLYVTSRSASEIWVGTDLGISRLEIQTGRFTHHRHEPGKPHTLSNNSVRVLHFGRDGMLWVGTWGGGLNRLDPKTGRVTAYMVDANITHNVVVTIAEDPAGLLWLGTFGKGVARFDPQSAEMTFYQANPDQPGGLRDNVVNTLYLDRLGMLWIGTAGGGLSVFDPSQETWATYDVSDGLPSSEITGILEDDHGALWISTGKGLSRFDRKEKTFTNYDVEDGLQASVFYANAYCKASTGEMYFGGLNGFNVFYPADIEPNPFIPNVMITDLQIFNASVRIGEKFHGRVVLTRPIFETREIILSHREYVFSLEFSALHFAAPSKNRFAYRLEGVDKDWIPTDPSRRFVTYTMLKPGRYVFKVKAANNDGTWNPTPTELGITILPPFYQRVEFQIVAGVALLCLILAAYSWRVRNLKRQEHILSKLVSERTEALRRSTEEMEAFAYSVSHDLRAPLRAMDGYSVALLEDYADRLDEQGKKYLSRIRSASHHMARLIDDLLKLSRVSRCQIHREWVDLSGLAESIAESLQKSDPHREVEFLIAKGLFIKGDPFLLQILMQNLLDNAWKFTSKKSQSRIEVGSLVQKHETIYYVKDNGIGFDVDFSDRLFVAFQREHAEYEGTGIGLTTVQRIVQRHGGRVWAEGKPGEGAVFYFTIGGDEKMDKGHSP